MIQVHKKLTISESRGVMYETELLEEFADTDAAKDFFARLDLQLNKVNKFYSAKEKEFLERGESLKKQMQILLELKAALKNQRGRISSTNDAKDDPSISCSISSGINITLPIYKFLEIRHIVLFSSIFLLFGDRRRLNKGRQS